MNTLKKFVDEQHLHLCYLVTIKLQTYRNRVVVCSISIKMVVAHIALVQTVLL